MAKRYKIYLFTHAQICLCNIKSYFLIIRKYSTEHQNIHLNWIPSISGTPDPWQFKSKFRFTDTRFWRGKKNKTKNKNCVMILLSEAVYCFPCCLACLTLYKSYGVSANPGEMKRDTLLLFLLFVCPWFSLMPREHGVCATSELPGPLLCEFQFHLMFEWLNRKPNRSMENMSNMLHILWITCCVWYT